MAESSAATLPRRGEEQEPQDEGNGGGYDGGGDGEEVVSAPLVPANVLAEQVPIS